MNAYQTTGTITNAIMATCTPEATPTCTPEPVPPSGDDGWLPWVALVPAVFVATALMLIALLLLFFLTIDVVLRSCCPGPVDKFWRCFRTKMLSKPRDRWLTKVLQACGDQPTARTFFLGRWLLGGITLWWDWVGKIFKEFLFGFEVMMAIWAFVVFVCIMFWCANRWHEGGEHYKNGEDEEMIELRELSDDAPITCRQAKRLVEQRIAELYQTLQDEGVPSSATRYDAMHHLPAHGASTSGHSGRMGNNGNGDLGVGTS